MSKISSLSDGYQSGDLSVYPEAIDDKTTLYEGKNNAETILKQSLTYNAKHIIVEDTSAFPPAGLLRIGPSSGDPGNAELIFYGKKTDQIFSNLSRGHAGSIQTTWAKGAFVTNAVMAEHHNAVKDAILNIENTIGDLLNPEEGTIHRRLKDLETKFLAPKAIFRAYPTEGKPSLTVRFQSFSEGDVIRYFWEFGDGTSSIEKNPNHTYTAEGIYTVKLTIITSTGATGITTKSNYIEVSNEIITPFFYYELVDNNPAYSTETAAALMEDPGIFRFVDQTDGDISQRYWIFDDGTSEAVLDPDIHVITHTYDVPGNYNPSLLVILANENPKRVFLSDVLTVL